MSWPAALRKRFLEWLHRNHWSVPVGVLLVIVSFVFALISYAQGTTPTYMLSTPSELALRTSVRVDAIEERIHDIDMNTRANGAAIGDLRVKIVTLEEEANLLGKMALAILGVFGGKIILDARQMRRLEALADLMKHEQWKEED